VESQIHDSAPPAALLNALERKNANLRYTDAKAVYFCLGLWGEACCGVFGDGDNAAYEWFVWQDGKLETSDCAYGSSSVALRCANSGRRLPRCRAPRGQRASLVQLFSETTPRRSCSWRI
jgi:hypothetical protein